MSRGTHEHNQSLRPFVYRTITVYGGPFQQPSTRVQVYHSVGKERLTPAVSYNPGAATPVAYTEPVWADPLSLTTTRGILSIPPGTEMFQFPDLPPARLCVQREVTWLRHAGFPHSGILG